MNDEQRDMLDALLDLDFGMTGWEADFVDQIDQENLAQSMYWLSGLDLSLGRAQKLRQIYDERIVQGNLAGSG